MLQFLKHLFEEEKPMPEPTVPAVTSVLFTEVLKIVLPELIKLLQDYETKLNAPAT